MTAPFLDIYAFRHGETDYNAEHRFQGSLDIPLNALGRQQAQSLAELLHGRGLEKILSSPLARAHETARIVAAHIGLSISLEQDLREIHCGEAEGMLRTDAIAKYSQDFWDRWRSAEETHMDLRFPQGESKRECLQRALKVMHALAADTSNSSVALSLHGAVLRYLVHSVIGFKGEAIAVPNCAVYLLRYRRVSGDWEFIDFQNMARVDHPFFR